MFACSGEQALLEVRQLWGHGGADEDSSEGPEVRLHSATVLDWLGETVEELSLSSDGNETFVSEPFTVPRSHFMVRLRGLDCKGEDVVRVSSFAVQPADVDLALGQLLSWKVEAVADVNVLQGNTTLTRQPSPSPSLQVRMSLSSMSFILGPQGVSP